MVYLSLNFERWHEAGFADDISTEGGHLERGIILPNVLSEVASFDAAIGR